MLPQPTGHGYDHLPRKGLAKLKRYYHLATRFRNNQESLGEEDNQAIRVKYGKQTNKQKPQPTRNDQKESPFNSPT